jgi:hypothetical protein
MDELHEMVLLTPETRIPRILSWFIETAPPLQRFDPCVRGEQKTWTVIRGGGSVSIAMQNETPGSINLDAEQDSSLRAYAFTYKQRVTSHTVRSVLRPEQLDKINAHAINIAAGYYADCAPIGTAYVEPIDRSIRNYQAMYRPHDPNAKPSMHAWSSPLIPGACAPERCLNNDIMFAQQRVKHLETTHKIPNKDYARVTSYMEEFISFFPEAIAHPFTVDDVYERQPRPTQQAILDEARSNGFKPFNEDYHVSSFMKREAYASVKDTRCISTIEGSVKLAYSQYMYAIAEVLKENAPWYAFGMNPKQIAERVAMLCEKAQHGVGATDCSRMDGRITAIARELEKMFCLRVLAREHHDEFLKLFETQHHRVSHTTFGYTFLSVWARLSGSPETSLFNTLLNAFMAYMCLRVANCDASKQECWDALGIYGGDDGLTADADAETYGRVAEWVGQKLTYDFVPRGGLGVNFLARYYSPHVWYGDPNSMSDLKRQLSKWHVTTTHPASGRPREKIAAAKALGYWLTDRNTPVLGALAARTLEITGVVAEGSTWWSRYSTDVQFPNDVESFGEDYLREMLPAFDRKLFDDWLEQVNTFDELTSPPLCDPETAPDLKQEAVVNGEYVKGPKAEEKDPMKDHTRPEKQRKRGRRGKRGAKKNAPASTAGSSKDKSDEQGCSSPDGGNLRK